MDTLMPIMIVWSEIERLMELRGIPNRDALANVAGIHRTNLYKIAKGDIQPSLLNLGKICGALECQPGDLLRFVPDTKPQ
jgi:DNA-binding Xre family transcriptional regulator